MGDRSHRPVACMMQQMTLVVLIVVCKLITAPNANTARHIVTFIFHAVYKYMYLLTYLLTYLLLLTCLPYLLVSYIE